MAYSNFMSSCPIKRLWPHFTQDRIILRDHFGKTILGSKTWHSCLIDEKKNWKTFMLSVWEKSRWSFKVSKYNKNGAIWKSLQILSNKTLSGLNKSYNISLPQEKFAEKSLHLPLIKLDLIISYLISYLVSLKMGYVITLLRYLRPW